MRFRNRETDLERELRAQRPQPREQFVQMLSGREAPHKPTPTPTPKLRPNRRPAPRIALVLVVSLVFAASLGVAGAVGYAKHSVTTFSTNVFHIVHASHHTNNPGDPDDNFNDPFRAQYDLFRVACFLPTHHLIFVFRAYYDYLLLHYPTIFGPPSACFPRG